MNQIELKEHQQPMQHQQQPWQQMRQQQQQLLQQQQQQEPVSLLATDMSAMCPTHGQPLVMFCLKPGCNALLCPSCPIQYHSNHKLVGLNEKFKGSVGLQQKKDNLLRKLHGLQTFDAIVAELKREITEKCEVAQKAINQKVDAVIQATLEQAETLKQKVKEVENQEKEKLNNLQGAVQSEMAEVYQILHQMETLPDSSIQKSLTDVQTMLQDYEQFIQSCTTVQGQSVPVKHLVFTENKLPSSIGHLSQDTAVMKL